MWVYLNSGLVPEAEACVSVFDRGFTYGDGFFETLRVYRGRGFQIDAHLDRIERAAAALRFRQTRSREGIAGDIQAVLEENHLSDAIVRISMTRGRGGRGAGIADALDPTYVVAAWPLPADLPDRLRRGTRLSMVPTRRLHPQTQPPFAKLGSYLNSILSLAEAHDRGAEDALMLTVDGRLAETSVANFFFVRSGILCTPSLDLGVLPGVTRSCVLRLAREAGIGTEEAGYPPEILEGATEAFVTNSVVGVLPVAVIGNGDFDREFVVPGTRTLSLMEAYQQSVRRETGGEH